MQESAETQKTELRASLSSLRNIKAHAQDVNYEELWLLNPNGKYHVAWDFFIGLVIFYSVIMIPFRMAFEVPIVCWLFVSDWVETSLFALDLSQNFVTAVHDEINQRVITDYSEIAQEYFKLWFWIDLASTLPVGEMVEQRNYCTHPGTSGEEDEMQDLKTLRLVRVLRLVRLFKLARVLKLGKLAHHIEQLNISPAILNVVKLVVQIFFVAHLFSCMWHFLTLESVIGDDRDTVTWRKEFESSFHLDMEGYRDAPADADPYSDDDNLAGYESSVAERYFASFYWTIATMLAVGYGDISATNTYERVYAILTMLCGGIMFGAVIAQVTRLIESRNPQARAFKMRMDELKAYLTEKKLPLSIKKSAKEAYSYFYSRQSTLAETGIFEDLPSHLLFKLIHNIYYKEIHKIDLFRSMDDNFMQFILMHTKPFQSPPGVMIFNSGDVAEEVVFLMIGLVRISFFDGRRYVVAGYAKEGGFFGDFEYYKRSLRVARYDAVLSCNMLSIQNRSLDEAMDFNVDAGFSFKKELRRRYEVFLDTVKSRTVGADPASMGESVSYTDMNSTLNPDVSLQTSGKPNGKTKWSTIIKTNDLLHKILAKAKEKKGAGKFGGKVAASCDGKDGEYSDTDSDDNLSSLSTKIIGDPKKPKVFIKVRLWVDGFPRNNTNAALEGKSTSEDDPLFRTLRERRPLIDKETGTFVRQVTEERASDIGKRLMFFHRGPNKNRWDILVGLLIMYCVLVIPMQTGFAWKMGTVIYVIDLIGDIIFTIDIPIAFCTTYYDHDEDVVVTVPSMCYWNYIRGWFIIDASAQVPFFIALLQLMGAFPGCSSLADSCDEDGDEGGDLGFIGLIRIVRLLRLLKLARLAKLGHHLAKLEDSLGINPITFDLLKMMMEVAFIGHMLACCWWAASNLTTNNWTDRHEWDESHKLSEMDENDFPSKYVISVYWAFTTLATVGYGDIVPTNMTHRIVVIIIMVLGATVFGYIVANVSTLMSDINQSAARVSERISEITEFLTEKNCPKTLSHSIIRHFRNMMMQTSAFDEPGILQRLPNAIVREILLTQHHQKIKKISLFNFIENQSVVLFIFRMMTPTYFEEHQAVLLEGEIGNAIYFIISGRARVFKAKSTEELVEARINRAKTRKEMEVREAQAREQHQKMRRQSVSIKSLGKSLTTEVKDEKTAAHQDEELEAELTVPLGLVGEGDFIGHVALMYRARHQATVRATNNMTAYALERSDFQRVVMHHPGVALVLQMALGEAIHAQSKSVEKLFSRESRIDFLKELKEKFNEERERKSEALKVQHAARKTQLFGAVSPSAGGALGALGRMTSMTSLASPGGHPILKTPVKTPQRARSESSFGVLSLLKGKKKGDDVMEFDADEFSDSENGEGEGSKGDLENTNHSRAPGQNYLEKNALGMPTNILPYDHPSRVNARRRWHMIRKMIEGARVSAAVARMNMQVDEEAAVDSTSPPSMWSRRRGKMTRQEEEHQAKMELQGRMSVFARAMASKLGEKVGIALDHNQMNYDSDEDVLKDPIAKVKAHAVKVKHRTAEDFIHWLDQTKHARRPNSNRRQSFPSKDNDEWKTDVRNLHII